MSWHRLRGFIKPEKWGIVDLRNEWRSLFDAAQEKLAEFQPVRRTVDGQIQVIDFFSGAGGTSLGFAAINRLLPCFKMLGGCDINRVSAETYSHNYRTPLLNTDVRELAYSTGVLDERLNTIAYSKNKPTILVGCAPCQGFSSHRKKHWREKEDQRNDLVLAFMEIVKAINPVAILMENVPEFLSGRYWEHFHRAQEIMVGLGYVVKDNIYNAAEFGVPQERFRSVVIAMKKNFVLPTGFLRKDNFHTVRDAIGDLPPVAAGVADPNDSMHKSANHKIETIQVIRQVPHDGGSRPPGVGPRCLDRTKGFSDVYGRLYWDRPSITITHYARNPASGRYSHPEQDRGLTAREVARLQSFPNGFVFTGKMDDIYRQIGEAVPPLLALGVVTRLLVELLSCEPTYAESRESPDSINTPVSNSYSSVIAGIKMARRKA